MTDDIKCPICGSKTTLRTFKKTGSKYHVCVNYPKCKGRVEQDQEWEDDSREEERTVEKRPRVYHDRNSGERRTSGISVAALVCGILGIVIPYVGLVLALLGIVFGGVGISQTGKNPNLGGRGMAITGLVCGIIAIAFWVLMILLVGSIAFWAVS